MATSHPRETCWKEYFDPAIYWGFFTLQAATHPAGNVAVIAFEPDPTNDDVKPR
jgi:hypothetical protein